MQSENSEFARLMSALRSGSSDAARELLHRYGEYVIRAVRRRLNRQLRSKFDSADFAQAVWGSFFSHLDSICCLDGQEELIAFLTRVATNKVIDETRRRLACGKHDIKREQRLEECDLWEAKSRGGTDPTPSDEAIARESWERLLAGCSERDRTILHMKRDGCTYFEIAEALSVNERTVRRSVERALDRVAT